MSDDLRPPRAAWRAAADAVAGDVERWHRVGESAWWVTAPSEAPRLRLGGAGWSDASLSVELHPLELRWWLLEAATGLEPDAYAGLMTALLGRLHPTTLWRDLHARAERHRWWVVASDGGFHLATCRGQQVLHACTDPDAWSEAWPKGTISYVGADRDHLFVQSLAEADAVTQALLDARTAKVDPSRLVQQFVEGRSATPVRRRHGG